MKIHAYILCYNEEQIIRSTLAHYSKFCTRVFLMDNMSTDRTLEYAAEFDKVTVIPWKDEKIDQRMLVKMKSRTFRNYSREGGKYTGEIADWIISVDADEIVYHPDLPALLSQYKDQGITVPDIAGYEIIDEHSLDPSVPMTEQLRWGVRACLFDKRTIFDVDFDMQYSGGCHPRGPGFEHMKFEINYRPSDCKEILLLHYKYVGQRHIQVAKRNLAKAAKSGDAFRAPEHYQRTVDGTLDLQKQHPERVEIVLADGQINPRLFPITNVNNGLWSDRIEHAETLRDIALRLERDGARKYLQECRDLMQLARLFKPGGQLIIDKLAQYNGALGGQAKPPSPDRMPSALTRAWRRVMRHQR